MSKDKTSPRTPATSLDSFAVGKLTKIAEAGLTRVTRPTDRQADMTASREGKTLISFADNDYLGLSQHPEVKIAAAHAAIRYGAGSGASRLVTGDHILYLELEERLARIKGSEAALVFGSGFMANTGIIPTLVGKNDLVLADTLIHASMHAGIKLSGATTMLFAHNDAADAKRILEEQRGNFENVLILVEGVYSMDGDMAPIKAIAEAAAEHNAWFMVDDAHGLGVIGGGKGAVAADGASGMVPLQMGTLSKGVGAYGGYLAASKPVIELMKNRARAFIYTTALPPATIAGASAALKLIENDKALTAKPMQYANYFCDALGLKTPASPIVPLLVGSADKAMAASKALEVRGFIVTAFRPPTVAEGTSRLRFCFSASHKISDIDALIKAVKSLNIVSTI